MGRHRLAGMANQGRTKKNTSAGAGVVGSGFQVASNGLSSLTPLPWKSAVLRVINTSPYCLAVAAIHASFSGAGSGICRAAQTAAVRSSIGRMRPANSPVMMALYHARNTCPCAGSLRSIRRYTALGWIKDKAKQNKTPARPPVSDFSGSSIYCNQGLGLAVSLPQIV